MPPLNVVWLEAYCSHLVRKSFCASVHRKTLLIRYLGEYLIHFHKTYINDALWDTDVCVTIWGQRSRSWWNEEI